VIDIPKDISTEEMIEIAKGIAQGKGMCLTCHTIGQSGALRFPDLGGIGERAASRIPGMSDVEYLVQSLYEPDTYVVEGFNPGMPTINKAPIGLTDDEILTLVVYLQSLGGTPSVTMETKHAYNGGSADVLAEAGDTGNQDSTISADGTTASSGESLFELYGCAACHSVTSPVGEPASSLHTIGERLDYSEILATILDPDNIPALSESEAQEKKAAMEAAGVYNKATLAEIQALAEFLVARRGNE
jgi:cytochrome c2